MKSLLDRMEDKVLIGDDCWNWQGALTVGYASLGSDSGETVYGHIEMYKLLVGPVPTGWQLHHLCRNRRCVRPDHLECKSHADHVREHRTGFRKSLCVRGHEYNDENTYYTNSGKRQCRLCQNQRGRERRLGL